MLRPTLLATLVLLALLALAGHAGAIPPEPCTWFDIRHPPCPL